MIDLAQSVLMLQMMQSRQFGCIQEEEDTRRGRNQTANVFICLDNAEKNKGIS